MANIRTCATRGKTFGRKYVLRRHENTVHSEGVSSGDKDSPSEDSESENEERPEVERSKSETSPNVDLEDNGNYQRCYERRIQVSEPGRTNKYETYVGAGMAEQRAREKAYERTLWATRSNFLDTWNSWKPTYSWKTMVHIRRLLPTLKKKMRRGLDSRKAV